MKISLTEISHEEKRGLGQLIGQAPSMKKIYTQMRKSASIDIPVLLQGETGTGKDLVAHSIHMLSACSDGPYIPVNLGALPSEMIASELFGHEKGAFTGAISQRKGKFEQAKHGTLFLDEIEAVDEKTQVSLLRVIEQKRYFRLGGKRQISSNARIIAASNENLQRLVEQGTFREDLYFRLEVFPIHIPPLRKRKGDMPLLASQFLTHYTKLLKKQITHIDAECLSMLESYSWPGNIRELKNLLQRAVVMCDGTTLLPEHFAGRLHSNDYGEGTPTLKFPIGTSLDHIERTTILHTLEFVDNNRTEAAKLLGISRRALYNRLKKHRIA